MNAHINRNRWLWLAPLALALLGILLVLLPARAAGPWYVAPGGNDSNDCLSAGAACEHIAAAIGKASAGDTIQIDAGMYTENLTVDKALVFVGAGAATAIVDGGGTNQIMNITGAAVSMQGLTLCNGNAGGGNGGALWANSPLTLTSVVILTNTAYWGGGVYAEADVVVSDSRFENKSATGPDVSNNVRKGGGGLDVTGDLAVRNTDFVGNRTAGDGGGLSIRGNATIIGGSFLRNANSNLSIGSGAAIAITGTLYLSGTQVISNSGGQAGGAIVAGAETGQVGGDTTLINSRLQQNSSARSSGGARYTYGSVTGHIYTENLTTTLTMHFVEAGIAGVTTDMDSKSRGNPPTMGAFEGTVDIYLRSLALSSGALTPVFTRTVTIYTARVAQEVASIVVTPTASSPTAVLTVNGAAVASGAPSAPLALSDGPNPITVTVASPDAFRPATTWSRSHARAPAWPTWC